jgi:predicted ATPase/DNA-binding CsgD family transcriptional regulator
VCRRRRREKRAVGDPSTGNTSIPRDAAGGDVGEPRRKYNLPLQLTSLVGREGEISEVRDLLAGARLLTLTGPGGSGKTRLALAVAGGLIEDFEDGVWLVELAPLSDPELVPQAVASVLGVREAPGDPLSETLADRLRAGSLLLVLDNCEHLVDACAILIQSLLRRCPGLRVLTTSREMLGMPGEFLFAVPPLSLPDPRRPPAVEGLSGYEAVRLFAERARAVKPDFAITGQNALAVAQICYRLDGIPLAIELAAARTRVLTPEQISARLEASFRLLSGGGRQALARHATLRAATDWSHDLLSAEEKSLFARLSAFAGGFSLVAAEEVGSGGGIARNEVLDLLEKLVDRSMVTFEEKGGGARYRLLETLRQYASEKLSEAEEAERVRRRHTLYFLRLAEEAEPELKGAHQETWLGRLEREHDNFRAALSWALERDEAELALRMSGALGEFWYLSGHLSEGRRWLEAALAGEDGGPDAARARALTWAGAMRWITREHDDYERLTDLGEEGLALYRRLGNDAEVALALQTLAYAESQRNRLERASTLAEEAIRLQRASSNTGGLARSLPVLGFVALARNEHGRAVALHEENLALAREAEDSFAIVVSLIQGSLAYSGLGELRRARTLCKEGLGLSWQLKMMPLLAGHLHVSAVLAGLRGRADVAARLWGAAEALRESLGISLAPIETSYYTPLIDEARSRLDEASWEAAWAEGRAMPPGKAVEYALSSLRSAENPPSPTAYPADLSAREVEVLELVARGLTNARIASELYISPRTVNAHLGSVYHKIGSHSRAEAARFATEHGLL